MHSAHLSFGLPCGHRFIPISTPAYTQRALHTRLPPHHTRLALWGAARVMNEYANQKYRAVRQNGRNNSTSTRFARPSRHSTCAGSNFASSRDLPQGPFGIMAVSRSPRSPQKAMATLLCLALVFSLGLIAASRKTDMHLIHDRHGGHLEHDHHRLFDHGHVGGMGHSRDPMHGVHPTLAARNGALNRYSWDTFSHRATTVGADGSRGIGETSLDTRFGGARDSSGGSGLGELSTGTAGSRTRVPGVQGSSSGDEEAFGDRHTGNFGGGVLSDEDDANRSERSSSRFNGEDNLDSFVVPVAKQSGGWMHEVWDETNHLTHEVEKLAGLRERHHGKERLGTQKTGSVSFHNQTP